MPCISSRRDTFTAIVDAYNRAHSQAKLPRSAARLLAVMFSDQDECSRSLEDLAATGFGKNGLPKALRALVEAGFIAKQPSALGRQQRGSPPTTYRLHLPSGEGAR